MAGPGRVVLRFDKLWRLPAAGRLVLGGIGFSSDVFEAELFAGGGDGW